MLAYDPTYHSSYGMRGIRLGQGPEHEGATGNPLESMTWLLSWAGLIAAGALIGGIVTWNTRGAMYGAVFAGSAAFALTSPVAFSQGDTAGGLTRLLLGGLGAGFAVIQARKGQACKKAGNVVDWS